LAKWLCGVVYNKSYLTEVQFQKRQVKVFISELKL
jgi:hypothetical protein